MATDFLSDWRIADRAASAAEKSVFQESMAFIESDGAAPPTPAAVESASRLRALADTLFGLAMSTFYGKAPKLRR